MEVLQDSYKDTKIGRIPKDWDLVILNDLLHLLTDFEANGSFASVKENVQVSEGKDYAWYVRATDLENKSSLDEVKYVNESSYAFLKKTKLDGDEVLITKRGEIGKVYHFIKPIETPCTLAPNLYLLKINNKVYSKYLYYYFKNNDGNKLLKRINGSTTIGALYKNDVKKIKVKLPPLPEQQKIAEILSTVDKQISVIERIIEKSKELKKGLMQKLFSEGIGHTEFKDTKIGRIPMEWELSRIGSVADCSGGTTPSTTIEEYWNGNILWATPTDITSNNSVRLIETSRKITEEGRKSKNLKYVSKDGLLMTSRASIGFVKISNGDVTTNQGFINIECKNRIHYKYLYFWIIQNRGLLMRFSQGSTFLELYRTAFKKLPIPLPPLPEQQKIVSILTEADKKIEKEEQYKSELEQLKRGLMQQLLTGQKRVRI